jgi:apolipoprotein N-acyltransferase
VAQETVVGQGAGAEEIVPARERVRWWSLWRRAWWDRRDWRRGLAAAGAGLVMFLAFPPNPLVAHGSNNGWWPLAVPGTALFALAVRGVRPRTGAWLGLICGLAFFLPLLDWARVIGIDAWAGLSLLEAVYYIPMGAAAALATRLRGWPVWTAALWVGQEAIRGRFPLGGLPWGRLGFSQTASPLTPYAALGGVPLVSFVTALAGGLLALAVLRSPLPGSISGRLSGFAVDLRVAAVAVAGIGLVFTGGLLVPVPTSGKPVTVAVIQGNVPRTGLDADSQVQAVFDNHIAETLKLADEIRRHRVPRPQLVIWPENADDLDPYQDFYARFHIQQAVDAVGVPVLIGAVITAPDNPDKVQNRGIVWAPRTGPGAYYVKRHPVPFGEYVPYRDVLTKIIHRFSLVPRDFEAGRHAGNLRLGPVGIGDVICFEVAYDGIVRDVARSPLLVVQTNNATYGHTSQPWQQMAMSRLRAVEHGRSVLVAATSGISGIIRPDGKVIAQSREFTPYLAVAAVPTRTSRTVADRLGSGVEWALVAVGVAALVVAVRMTGAGRGAATGAEDSVPGGTDRES